MLSQSTSYICSNMKVSRDLLSMAYTWPQYVQLFEQLVAEGKTTGTDQSPSLVDYTRLNLQRSQRVSQQLKLTPSLELALQQLDEEWVWLVLTEIWCGDAAQNLPLLGAIADYCPKITLRLILRDEHTEVMDQYLTNGGRAIPILVCLRAADLQPLGHWGPRPAPAQQIVMDYKANPIMTKEEMYANVHHWYAKDHTATQQLELLGKIKEWQS